MNDREPWETREVKTLKGAEKDVSDILRATIIVNSRGRHAMEMTAQGKASPLL